MEILTDMQKVKESKCFGIAWDGEVAECKICEVASVCKQRTLGGVKQAPTTKNTTKKTESVDTMKPATPRPEPNKNVEVKESTKASKEETPKKTTKKAAKSEVNYNSDMPDFKPMSVEELIDLAKERGLNPADFDKYTNVGIKKMRVTMALKKTYEVK